MKYHVAVLGASIMALAHGSVAHAQDTATKSRSAPADESSSPVLSNEQLAEIVVTAQRRAESAQDVPIAVAAFGADQLEKNGISSTADLPSVIPGVVINPSGVRSPLIVRGVGTNVLSTAPNVLTFIDGVYQPFDNTGGDFSNIERMEIAKGPQGTLFGRNATGGVLQIITRNPFDWQGLDVQLGYANYDTYSAKAYGSAKFSDMLAADIAGFYYNQTNGWGKNLADGSDFYTAKRYGVRSKWVAKLGEDFRATLTGDYAYREGQLGASISPSVTDSRLYNSITDTFFTLPTHYDVLADTKPLLTSKEAGVALTLEKTLGEIKLLSISSYRGVNELQVTDFDGTDTRIPGPGGTSFPVFTIRNPQNRRSFTQEVQVSGGNGSLNWTAGLYYFWMRSKIDADFGGFLPFLPFVFNTGSPTVPLNIQATDTTNAYAAYGQATVEILPDTRLTLGARYTIEKRRLEGFTTGSITFSPTSAGVQEKTFKKPNFRVALDHKLTPDILIYASWNRGFNAGFFNNIPTIAFNETFNPVVEPEVINAYEIGVKSDLLGRRLRVNVAAFLYNYTNLQQQIFEFGNIRTINAASARIKGVDIDVVARPMRDLTLSVSANILDSEYLSYPLAPFYQFVTVGPPGTRGFKALGSRDAAGNELVNAPPFGLQASATYTLRTSIGTFDTTGTVNYQSHIQTDPQNNFPIPRRTLVNLTEQWTSNDGDTTVTAWVKNLTNKVYNVSYSLLDPVGLVGNPGAPRTYGVTIGRKF